MTKRLYLEDAFALRFHSVVRAHGAYEGKPSVLLAQSAFYPEAGGQLADRGTLGGVAVTDVQADDAGEVHHLLEGALPEVGAEVEGLVDGERRRQHRADHTGQHMLSHALLEVAEAATVSARLGEQGCTIDVGVPALSDAQLARAEDLVNARIDEDLAVRAYFPTPEELARLPLRRAPKVTENIRVVCVGEWDFTPCGGTHVAHTAQVGDVRLTGAERYKGMLRVHFTAGRRALRGLHAQDAALRALGQRFSCAPGDVSAAVEKLQRELEEQRRSAVHARGELGKLVAQELVRAQQGAPLVSARFEEGGVDFARTVAARALALGAPAVLVGALGEGGVSVVLERGAGVDADCGAALKALAARFGGRGGGRKERAEGRLAAEHPWALVSEAARALLGFAASAP